VADGVLVVDDVGVSEMVAVLDTVGDGDAEAVDDVEGDAPVLRDAGARKRRGEDERGRGVIECGVCVFILRGGGGVEVGGGREMGCVWACVCVCVCVGGGG
jgi:hypothetical protein